MKELSPRAQALLKRAGPAGAPAAGAQARVHRALQTRIAGGVALGASGGVLKAAWAASGLKVLGAVSVIGAAAATWQAYQAPNSASSSVVPAAVESHRAPLDRQSKGEQPAVAPLAETKPIGALAAGSRVPAASERRLAAARTRGAASVAPAAVESAPHSAPPRAAQLAESMVPHTAVSPAADEQQAPVAMKPSLNAETEALRAVQRAIRDGKSEHALQLLNEDDVRFTRGGFAQERSAARVLALCKLARVELARAEAQRFLQRWPQSPLLGRVQAACR